MKTFVSCAWLLLAVMALCDGILAIMNVKENQNTLCKQYVGQTIIKKQIPNYLIFKDDKYVEGFDNEHQWFESKKIGDLFTKEDCKKIKSN